MRSKTDDIGTGVSGPGDTPGGAVVAAADTVLDLFGPANEMTTQVLQQQAKVLIAQIQAVDPAFHDDELGLTDAFGTPIFTVQGLSAKVNDLRFQRAAVLARVQGDYGPLQWKRCALSRNAPTRLIIRATLSSKPAT